MSSPKKISTEGGQNLAQNPFEALGRVALPDRPPSSQPPMSASSSKPSSPPPKPAKNRGRVDIVREKAGRGGKTVTVACGFVGIGLPEKEQLAKKMQKACGVGGTVKEGRIEIQGDKRDEVARILTEAGFQPIFAGG